MATKRKKLLELIDKRQDTGKISVADADDPISTIIREAVNNANEPIDAWNEIEYAITQLQRAQAVLSKNDGVQLID